MSGNHWECIKRKQQWTVVMLKLNISSISDLKAHLMRCHGESHAKTVSMNKKDNTLSTEDLSEQLAYNMANSNVISFA